tara:strand:+ start:151 stop:381 length:231 start_codon:yes stop_codon:yes gene_type:complete
MKTILIIILILYCIFLNLRIKDIETELSYLSLDYDELEAKLYTKMMSMRKEIKDSIKIKTVAKRRGGGTKKRSKLS